MASSKGYIEVSYQLVQPHTEWGPRELLAAARAAESGWVVGIVFDGSDEAPKPTVEGAIEARARRWQSSEWGVYWILGKDGAFYFITVFEEDFGEPQFGSSEGHPERMLWFDIRIWRIAEALLHSAALYRLLGVEPDQPYVLSMNHYGLQGREFYASKPLHWIRRGYVSSVERAEWRKVLTQDQVNAALRELVHEIADDLFVRFSFAPVSASAIDRVLDEFLAAYRSRV